LKEYIYFDLLDDRCGFYFLPLVALRRQGGITSLDTMNHFFLGGQMIVVGRGIAFGREIGEVEKDAEGIEHVNLLGQRMAWLLKKVHG
jgi:multimeric flavodoxin WrbA